MGSIFLLQVFVELIAVSASIIVLIVFLKRFNIGKIFLTLVMFPVTAFSIGFTLRLTGDKNLIDTGYFLTEYSLIFTYLIFASCCLLGQVKYWKIK